MLGRRGFAGAVALTTIVVGEKSVDDVGCGKCELVWLGELCGS